MAKARTHPLLGPVNGPNGPLTDLETQLVAVSRLVLDEGEQHAPDLNRLWDAVAEERKGIEDGKRLFNGSHIIDVVRSVKSGTIYVVGTNAHVKIGFTRGPVKLRVEALQTGSPEKIQIIWECPGSHHLERALHQKFADLRAAGEWFRREGEVAAWIAEGCPI